MWNVLFLDQSGEYQSDFCVPTEEEVKDLIEQFPEWQPFITNPSRNPCKLHGLPAKD